MNKTIRTLCGVVFVLAITGAEEARAALQVYESFAYGPAGSDLIGKNGGLGFSGAWTAGGFNVNESTNYDVTSAGLTYDDLMVGGGAAETGTTPSSIAGIYRNLANPIGGDATVKFMSFLIQPLDVTTSNWYGIYLRNGSANELFVGKGGSGAAGQWAIENRGGSGQAASGVNVALNQTYLLVVKMEFAAGADTVSLYVNPAVALLEPPVASAVKNDLDVGTVTGLNLYSRGGFRVDEIRIGDRFADVVPASTVPESSSAVLLVLGSSLIAGQRLARRRRVAR
jgi:hypothetical protein